MAQQPTSLNGIPTTDIRRILCLRRRTQEAYDKFEHAFREFSAYVNRQVEAIQTEVEAALANILNAHGARVQSPAEVFQRHWEF